MQERLDATPVDAAAAAVPARQVTWLKKDEMGVKLGAPVAIGEYRGLVGLLQGLWNHPNGRLVHADLLSFLRPASQKVVVAHQYKLDALGRSYATGAGLMGLFLFNFVGRFRSCPLPSQAGARRRWPACGWRPSRPARPPPSPSTASRSASTFPGPATGVLMI